MSTPVNFLAMLGLSLSDTAKPGFSDKVDEACDTLMTMQGDDETKRGLIVSARTILKFAPSREAYIILVHKDGPYNVLGVSEDASSAKVKKSYRDLMKRIHTDKCPKGVDENLFKECSQKINAAYEILKDQETRTEHDHKRKHSGDDNTEGTENTKIIKLSMHDFYCGVKKKDVKMAAGSVSFRIPPRTVPGWRRRFDDLEVVTELDMVTAGCYGIDDRRRLVVDNVEVTMVEALCGRGAVQARAPDGTVHTAKITAPLKPGDLIEFSGAGFGKDPMMGRVAVTNTSTLLTVTQRRAIWKYVSKCSPSYSSW